MRVIFLQVGGEVCLLELSVARVGEHDGKVSSALTTDDDDNDNGYGDDETPELENTM